MKRYVFGFVVFAVMAAVALSGKAADTDELMLQGEWNLFSIDVQGKMLPALVGKGGSIVFAKGGKLILKDPGKTDRIGKYKIDGEKIPKQIDLIVSKDDKAMQGIYELDDEKLKMAFSAEGLKGKRQEEFKGENVLIVHWKRQKS